MNHFAPLLANVFIDQFIVLVFCWFSELFSQSKSKPLHVHCSFDVSVSQTNLAFDWLRNRNVSSPLMTVSSGNRTASHLNVLVKDFTRLLESTLLLFLLLNIHVFLLSRIIEKKNGGRKGRKVETVRSVK